MSDETAKIAKRDQSMEATRAMADIQIATIRWNAIELLTFTLCATAFFCTCMVVTCGI